MKKKNTFRWFLIVLAGILIIIYGAGCTVQNGGELQGSDQESSGYPMTITDDEGRTVIIESEPQTIVSIMPSNTEILYALGLGDKIIGVTENCYYPEEAMEKEKVGSFTINIEKVVSLNPDLVLASRGQETYTASLTQFGINIVTLIPRNLEEICKSIEMVGRLTNTYEKAVEITKEMKREIEEIKELTQNLTEQDKPKVLILVDREELYSVGRNTFLNHMIETAGGINIAADVATDWPVLSEEKVFEEDPDFILCTYLIKDKIIARENWQELKALKNNQVYNVDNDLVSRPGPRVAKGLRLLYDILHH